MDWFDSLPPFAVRQIGRWYCPEGGAPIHLNDDGGVDFAERPVTGATWQPVRGIMAAVIDDKVIGGELARCAGIVGKSVADAEFAMAAWADFDQADIDTEGKWVESNEGYVHIDRHFQVDVAAFWDADQIRDDHGRWTKSAPAVKRMRNIGKRYKTFEEFTDGDDLEKPPTREEAAGHLWRRQARSANYFLANKSKPAQDFELRLVPTKEVKPSQHGEDYENESSHGTAFDLKRFAKPGGDKLRLYHTFGMRDMPPGKDIIRLEDTNPIALDEDGNILDGNHRHAAHTMNKEKSIAALVPVGPGTGEIRNLREVYDKISGKAAFYSPDQPRDDHGRWADGGDGTRGDTRFPHQDDLHKLEMVKALGGSTGAKLLADAAGNKFVAKRGNSSDHLLEEDNADRVYRALGVPVPDSRVYDTKKGPVKLSKFIDGLTPIGDALQKADPQEKKRLLDEAKSNFAADALLGNWDVAGAAYDNMMVAPNGHIVRIDNGGSMRFRAQGEKKTADQWNGKVGEIDTLRGIGKGSKTAQSIFKGLSDDQVRGQVHKILARRDAVLAALPYDLKPVMAERMQDLEKRFGSHNDRKPDQADFALAKSVAATLRNARQGIVGPHTDSELASQVGFLSQSGLEMLHQGLKLGPVAGHGQTAAQLAGVVRDAWTMKHKVDQERKSMTHDERLTQKAVRKAKLAPFAAELRTLLHDEISPTHAQRSVKLLGKLQAMPRRDANHIIAEAGLKPWKAEDIEAVTSRLGDSFAAFAVATENADETPVGAFNRLSATRHSLMRKQVAVGLSDGEVSELEYTHAGVLMAIAAAGEAAGTLTARLKADSADALNNREFAGPVVFVNPYHDADGKFTTAKGAEQSTIPNREHLYRTHDLHSEGEWPIPAEKPASTMSLAGHQLLKNDHVSDAKGAHYLVTRDPTKGEHKETWTQPKWFERLSGGWKGWTSSKDEPKPAKAGKPAEPAYGRALDKDGKPSGKEVPLTGQFNLHVAAKAPKKAYGGVIFDDHGNVLLREPSNHYDGYHWTFPKGGADENEHPVDSALREVAQETGHMGKIIGHIPGVFTSGGSSANYYYLMHSKGSDPSLMDNETWSTRWVHPTAARGLIEKSTNAAGRKRDLQILDAAVAQYHKLHGQTLPEKQRYYTDPRAEHSQAASQLGGWESAAKFEEKPMNKVSTPVSFDQHGANAAWWSERVYFDGQPIRRIDLLRKLERRDDMTEEVASVLLTTAEVVADPVEMAKFVPNAKGPPAKKGPPPPKKGPPPEVLKRTRKVAGDDEEDDDEDEDDDENADEDAADVKPAKAKGGKSGKAKAKPDEGNGDDEDADDADADTDEADEDADSADADDADESEDADSDADADESDDDADEDAEGDESDDADAADESDADDDDDESDAGTKPEPAMDPKKAAAHVGKLKDRTSKDAVKASATAAESDEGMDASKAHSDAAAKHFAAASAYDAKGDAKSAKAHRALAEQHKAAADTHVKTWKDNEADAANDKAGKKEPWQMNREEMGRAVHKAMDKAPTKKPGELKPGDHVYDHVAGTAYHIDKVVGNGRSLHGRVLDPNGKPMGDTAKITSHDKVTHGPSQPRDFKLLDDKMKALAGDHASHIIKAVSDGKPVDPQLVADTQKHLWDKEKKTGLEEHEVAGQPKLAQYLQKFGDKYKMPDKYGHGSDGKPLQMHAGYNAGTEKMVDAAKSDKLDMKKFADHAQTVRGFQGHEIDFLCNALGLNLGDVSGSQKEAAIHQALASKVQWPDEADRKSWSQIPAEIIAEAAHAGVPIPEDALRRASSELAGSYQGLNKDRDDAKAAGKPTHGVDAKIDRTGFRMDRINDAMAAKKEADPDRVHSAVNRGESVSLPALEKAHNHFQQKYQDHLSKSEQLGKVYGQYQNMPDHAKQAFDVEIKHAKASGRKMANVAAALQMHGGSQFAAIEVPPYWDQAIYFDGEPTPRRAAAAKLAEAGVDGRYIDEFLDTAPMA